MPILPESDKTRMGLPIHPIIGLIGKAIALHLLFGEKPSDNDTLMDFIGNQVKLYNEGR